MITSGDLVHYWKCDEGSGNSVVDTVAAYNGTWTPARWAAGPAGLTTSVNGTEAANERTTTTGAPASVDFAGEFTVSFWTNIRAQNTSGTNRNAWVFKHTDGTFDGTIAKYPWMVATDNAEATIDVFDGVAWRSVALSGNIVGVDKHICVVFTGGNVRVYENGVDRGTDTFTNSDASGNIYFGDWITTSAHNGIDGVTAEIALINAPITPAEVLELYNGGVPPDVVAVFTAPVKPAWQWGQRWRW